MPLFSRLRNALRPRSLNGEIDEEFQSHIEEAVRQGRDPAEVRRAFGPALQRREESRDIRLLPWLDSLRADAVFGLRQLLKRKATTAAAILSLALAIGSCTSAFRVIDALLLRPLPVAHSDRLYEVARHGMDFDGTPVTINDWAYPAFQLMRAAAKGRAELLALSDAERLDLTYRSNQEMEKASVQYVSGWMFGTFGLQPAAGRLFTENDDRTPGAHPYAVLSYDYWTRRFGRDPAVIGHTLRLGNVGVFAGNDAQTGPYEIVGVGPDPFTGTEPGTVTDVFLPTMMHPGATHDDWTWMRIMAHVFPGVALEPLRARLDATSHAFEENRAKGFKGMSRESIEKFLAQTVVVEPAAGGASDLQRGFRRPLLALAILVALVLLIACANIANLMTAQAAVRAREMALRVSIGAGRWRLVQLVLVECAWLGALAAAGGAWFAWWSAPYVVSRINPPDHPARLALPADWRVAGFALALTLAVTFLFGLAPALRASSVKPASALKGGSDPHSRQRLMHTLIAVQVAFCFLVLFVSGLFVATFDRLSHRPMGFSADRVLAVETVAESGQPEVFWDQVAAQLRAVPGVQSVALAGWALLGGGGWNGFVSVNGAPPGPTLAYFLRVSPGWLGTMKISLTAGRDFRDADITPGAAIVNQAFVRQFLGENPLGKVFAKGSQQFQVVGIAADAPYRSLREPIMPVAYVPFHSSDARSTVRTATLLVRTAGPNPLALASTLRREVPRARPGFRVSNIHSQADLVDAQTVRERLLAMLSLFFAAVALLLAGVGLYGVLDYSVLQRRREIGIRLAIGARPRDIARRVTADVFLMVLVGAFAGLALGLASVRYLQSVLYAVKPGDPAMLLLPWLVIVLAAALAAIPAVVRALRIEPVAMLRAE